MRLSGQGIESGVVVGLYQVVALVIPSAPISGGRPSTPHVSAPGAPLRGRV